MKTKAQLQAEIATARSGEDGQPQTTAQLINHIIGLYGAELELANEEIAQLRAQAKADDDMLEKLRHTIEHQKRANDDLFRIKQKVVIINRELLLKNERLEKAAAELARANKHPNGEL